MKVTLKPGARYAAGLDLPGLIPGVNGIAEGKFRDIGFKDARVYDLDEAPAALSQRPEAAGKDFDSVATGTYSGPAQQVELPSQVVWLAELAVAPATPKKNPSIQVLADAGYTKTAEVLRQREQALPPEPAAPEPSLQSLMPQTDGNKNLVFLFLSIGVVVFLLMQKNHRSRSPRTA